MFLYMLAASLKDGLGKEYSALELEVLVLLAVLLLVAMVRAGDVCTAAAYSV